MKSIAIFLIVLIFPLFINAQLPEIEWGPVYKSKVSSGKNYLWKKYLGSTKEHYYFLIGENMKKRRLLKFNYNNKVEREEKLDFKHNGKLIKYYEMVHTKAGSFIIGTYYDKKKRLASYYFYDLKKGSPKEMELLFELPYQNKGGLRVNIEGDYSGIDISPDSSLVLFSNVKRIKEFKQKKEEEYNFVVLDKDMNLFRTQNLTMPFKDKDFIVADINISNEGKISIFGKHKLKKAKDKITASQFEYYLFRVTENGIKKQIKINSDQGYIHDAKLITLGNGEDYIFGGYHQREKKPIQQRGYFLNKYDETGSEVFTKIYPWTKEILQYLKVNKKIYSQKGTIYTESFYVNTNKKVLTFFTQHKIDIYGSSVRRMDKKYETNSIFIPSFSFDGELKWMALVKRRFRGSHPKYLMAVHHNDMNYLVFHTISKGQLLFGDNIYKFGVKLMSINLEGKIDIEKTIYNPRENKGNYVALERSQLLNDGKLLVKKSFNGLLNTDYSLGVLKLR